MGNRHKNTTQKGIKGGLSAVFLQSFKTAHAIERGGVILQVFGVDVKGEGRQMAGLKDWHNEPVGHKTSLPLSTIERCINGMGNRHKNTTQKN
ncbi:hypothetical protein PT286_07440 [Neisseriaceae bacterium ESL0693]|nr:hypothetical protein [Neisseriaceae bacterium ESL0693]